MKPRTRLLLIFVGLLVLTFLAERWRRARLERSQDKNILAAAKKHGVDAALIKAVIWRESRFDPDARGGKGEIGLMQIMPDTGREWADAQRMPNLPQLILADPARNIECGTWYLGKLLKRYSKTDNPVPYALADYNAGRRNVLKWLNDRAATNSSAFIQQVGFPGTQKYVLAIMKRRARYAAWAEGAGSKQ